MCENFCGEVRHVGHDMVTARSGEGCTVKDEMSVQGNSDGIPVTDLHLCDKRIRGSWITQLLW